MIQASTNTEKPRSEPSTHQDVLQKARDIKHTRIANMKGLFDYYTFGEVLGKGSFGTVIEITDKVSNQVWALKNVNKQRLIEDQRMHFVRNEIKILCLVQHPNIIYLDRVFESTYNIYMVIERCDRELAVVLKEKKCFTEDESRKIMLNLSNAIAYLHKYGIVHRDLKLENILTSSNPHDPNDELYIKVSDFGLSTISTGYKFDQMLKERCGTLSYMAPEIISQGVYSQQCDIWSMGVICFLMITGSYPFFNRDEEKLKELICKSDAYYEEFQISPEAVHLMKKMLEKSPPLRITATEIERHPWMYGGTIDKYMPVNVLDKMKLWRDDTDMSLTTTNPAGDPFKDPAIVFDTPISNIGLQSTLLPPPSTTSAPVRRTIALNPTNPNNTTLNIKGKSTKLVCISKITKKADGKKD